MTGKKRRQLEREELEEQNGEALPDRDVISIAAIAPRSRYPE